MKRRVRGSDGTVSVEGVRYQVPAPWRHLREMHLRVARWDLSSVDLVDGRTGERVSVLYPVDKRRNAEGTRRRTDRKADDDGGKPVVGQEPAPLLRRILDDQAASGLPPLWLAHPQSSNRDKDDEQGDPS